MGQKQYLMNGPLEGFLPLSRARKTLLGLSHLNPEISYFLVSDVPAHISSLGIHIHGGLTVHDCLTSCSKKHVILAILRMRTSDCESR